MCAIVFRPSLIEVLMLKDCSKHSRLSIFDKNSTLNTFCHFASAALSVVIYGCLTAGLFFACLKYFEEKIKRKKSESYSVLKNL